LARKNRTLAEKGRRGTAEPIRGGHGFTAKIRLLKSGVVSECVGCSNDLGHSTEEFHLALSEARKPVVGLRDAEQRVRLIARRQDRMAKEPALN
jgi:hypothetical protein